MNFLRTFITLLIVLSSYSPLSAQATDEDDESYLNFAGSAVFRRSSFFEAGAGFTAAFGYAFKEGFSTEIEWGYQKVGIGKRIERFSQSIKPLTFTGPDGQVFQLEDVTVITPIIRVDGESKIQSAMVNFFYRYPKWKVSPYAGFGLGAFFHNVTYTVTYENECAPPSICPAFASGTEPSTIADTGSTYEDNQLAYQDHGRRLGSGLPACGTPPWLLRIPVKLNAESGEREHGFRRT